jgi:hypothetical protein
MAPGTGIGDQLKLTGDACWQDVGKPDMPP